MNAQVAIAVLMGLAASVEDLVRRRVSNWIPAVLLAAGVTVQALEAGWRGAGSAALGAALGFGVFLVFYLLGGMGGGDVKLMAGFGALVGAGRLLEAALWTGILGGLIAVGVLAAQWIRRRRSGAGGQGGQDSIPYAPAITMGVWLSLVPKG